MTNKEKTLFISHDNSDLSLAKNLQKQIKIKTKYKGILIVKNKTPGNIINEIEDGIKNCSYIIPILTPSGITSQWINQELGFAHAHSKKMLALQAVEVDSIKGFYKNGDRLPFDFRFRPIISTDDKTDIKDKKKYNRGYFRKAMYALFMYLNDNITDFDIKENDYTNLKDGKLYITGKGRLSKGHLLIGNGYYYFSDADSFNEMKKYLTTKIVTHEKGGIGDDFLEKLENYGELKIKK